VTRDIGIKLGGGTAVAGAGRRQSSAAMAIAERRAPHQYVKTLRGTTAPTDSSRTFLWLPCASAPDRCPASRP